MRGITLYYQPNTSTDFYGNQRLVSPYRLIDRRLRKPACVIVHSPFVDFTDSTDRSEHEINDFTVKVSCLKPLNDIYVKNHNPKNPYISPLYGDFSKFPPVFITCDYNEALFADSMAVYNKCKEAGTDVRMVQMKGAFHAFAITGTAASETKQILLENIEFFRKHSN